MANITDKKTMIKIFFAIGGIALLQYVIVGSIVFTALFWPIAFLFFVMWWVLR